MEATHIINPLADSGITPRVEADIFGVYIAADSVYPQIPSVFSGTFETETGAVAEWNGMFSKAPKMYGADGELV